MVNLFGTFVGFLSFFKSRDQGTAVIDNPIFRLHYDFTAGFFFLSTALLGLNDLFGKQIQCRDVHGEDASSTVLQYCFVDGTYTVPDAETIYKHLDGIGATGRLMIDLQRSYCKDLL